MSGSIGIINKKMKKYIKLILVIVAHSLFCNAFSQPSKSIIEQNVKWIYNQYSQMTGGASYDIKKIKVIEIKEVKDDTFVVKVIVKGTSKNYTIANDKRRKFVENLVFKYYLNSKNEWDYTTDNDPRKRNN